MNIEYDNYIIVTGGAGFIGSHFLDYFVARYPNHYFICIDKLSYVSNESTKFLKNVLQKPNFRFIKQDLASGCNFLYNLIISDCANCRNVRIINFAAESCVDRSFKDPIYFTTNNILSTQNLLECVRSLIDKCPNLNLSFFHISTDEVYGEQTSTSVDESAALNPTNPYAATKASLDLIIKAYQYSYGIPVTIIRSNNVYGLRQYPEKIIPVTLFSLFNKKAIPIHGKGNNKRNYLHVLDFIKAIELIMDSPEATGEVYNIGTQEEIDNLSLVALICKLYFESEDVELKNHVDFIKDRQYNDSRYFLNFSKIHKLGWRPEIRLKTGIKDLIKDYEKFLQTEEYLC